MGLPKRGEVWLADLGEPRGHEQAGARPALVLQTDILGHLSTLVVIPLITKPNRASSATHIPIPQGEAGLSLDSVALCHQIRALDKTRLQRQLGEVTAETLSEIEAAIAFLLNLPT
jgi:mRNA interferase MazF